MNQEVIPVPDSLEKEAFLIDVFTSRGNLKGHLMLISATPDFGDKVSCRNSGFILYNNMSLLVLSFLSFLRVSHFNSSRMPVILPLSRL